MQFVKATAQSPDQTYCFVYKSVIRRCRRVTPSASRAAALRNGWSPGTIARFGSFLFCSFEGNKGRRTPSDLQCMWKWKGGPTHPWIRNAARLYQNDPLQELDGGKLHASMHIRRPHELDYAVLRTRQRVPLQPFVLVRTSMLKEREGGRDISSRKKPVICV